MAQEEILMPKGYDDDFINAFKQVIERLNGMGYTYKESLQKAQEILEEAQQTNDMNESVQQQINTLITESGTSDAEVLQARIDAEGNEYPVLKERLDEKEQNFSSQLAQTEEQLKLSDLYDKVYGTTSLYNKPSGFPLEIPFNIYISKSGKVEHNYDVAVNKVPVTKRYYIDIKTGDNNNDGTEGSPFKTIDRAFRYGDADEIIVASGIYGWGSNIAPLTSQTKDFNVIGVGDVYVGAHRTDTNGSGLSWGEAEGYSNVYTVNASSVIEVIDINNGIDNPVFLQKVNSIEEVNNNPSSFYIEGSDVYVRLRNDSVPNDKILCNLRNPATVTADNSGYRNVYFENIKFTNTLEVNAPDNKLKVYAKKCDFAFGTTENAVSIYGDVFAIFQNCRALHAERDGFNYHISNGKTPEIIEINCEGFNNGRDGANQNNGSTMHDGGTILRVGGEYHNNHGPNVIDVNDGTQSLNIGVHAHNSTATSSLSNVDFRTRDDADMWLVNCVSHDSEYSTSTGSPARMYKENTLLLSEEVVI